MTTINMNNAALCELEQQDRTRPGALPGRRATTASAGPLDARGGATRPLATASVPGNARG